MIETPFCGLQKGVVYYMKSFIIRVHMWKSVTNNKPTKQKQKAEKKCWLQKLVRKLLLKPMSVFYLIINKFIIRSDY